MGAFDFLQSNATSLLLDAHVPAVDGGGVYIFPYEPIDLMASYTPDGNIYHGSAQVFTVAGRDADGHGLGRDLEPSFAVFFENAASGVVVADDHKDDEEVSSGFSLHSYSSDDENEEDEEDEEDKEDKEDKKDKEDKGDKGDKGVTGDGTDEEDGTGEFFARDGLLQFDEIATSDQFLQEPEYFLDEDVHFMPTHDVLSVVLPLGSLATLIGESIGFHSGFGPDYYSAGKDASW